MQAINTRILSIVIAAVVGAIVAVGLGISAFNTPTPPQTIEDIPSMSTPTTIPNPQDIVANTDFGAGVDEEAVSKLMIEEGLDRTTAVMVSQVNTEVKTFDETSITFVQSLATGETWDYSLQIIPNQAYSPAEEELEMAAETGRQIYDEKYSVVENGDFLDVTLSYFVPYDAMPQELADNIRASSASSTPAALAYLFPQAEASSGSSHAGAVFKTVIKGVAKEALGKLGVPSNIIGAFSVAEGLMALEGFQTYFSELNALGDCAQNPTNPLTKKAYDENPAKTGFSNRLTTQNQKCRR